MWLCLFAYSKYFGVVRLACLQVGGNQLVGLSSKAVITQLIGLKNGFLASDIFDVSLYMIMKKIEPTIKHW